MGWQRCPSGLCWGFLMEPPNNMPDSPPHQPVTSRVPPGTSQPNAYSGSTVCHVCACQALPPGVSTLCRRTPREQAGGPLGLVSVGRGEGPPARWGLVCLGGPWGHLWAKSQEQPQAQEGAGGSAATRPEGTGSRALLSAGAGQGWGG